MVIRISPNRTFAFLIGVSLGLAGIHILGQVSRLVFGHGRLYGLVPLFNMEEETNIPSLWSTCLWLGAGALAGLIAYSARRGAGRDWPHWTGLAGIFCAFGMDETIQFHERMGGVVVNLLRMEGMRATGFLYYVWIIPALIFAIVVFFVYLRFLMRLPHTVMALMVLGGAVFIAGSVGFELLEGPIDESGGYMNARYTAYVTFEESLEMIGVSILIFALLRYLADRTPPFEIIVSNGAPATT
ncbi:MAG: hypothetical protein HUU46_20280 [Candidatus Hydrogenedentes bacterium]|nr:hypothetical protein [Candidatus Hydrogenedentota bacterium]